MLNHSVQNIVPMIILVRVPLAKTFGGHPHELHLTERSNLEMKVMEDV
jgi:hypothetical protein